MKPVPMIVQPKFHRWVPSGKLQKCCYCGCAWRPELTAVICPARDPLGAAKTKQE